MNIRRIIKEELKKVFSENYPAGAQYDSNAPWNQVDPVAKSQAKEHPFNLLGWHQETAFFEKGGKYYVFSVESVDRGDYSDYAAREEFFNGYDEDGMPDVDYGDWEMDSDVIDNYVNDNYKHLTYGRGLDDYENGIQIVEVDKPLLQDLMSTAKYIKNDRERADYENVINTMASAQVNESGVTDNIVNKKTMDTPTGTLFIMDFGASGE
jgi:hypothetical protein